MFLLLCIEKIAMLVCKYTPIDYIASFVLIVLFLLIDLFG